MRTNPVNEGRRWLAQAAEDLKWAQRLADEGGWHIACFLAQQVAEKALNAFLYAQGEEIVLSPSVARLCSAAGIYRKDFITKGSAWSILDSYYIPTRYPNGLPEGIPAEVYTEGAARSAVSIASEVVVSVGELIR